MTRVRDPRLRLRLSEVQRVLSRLVMCNAVCLTAHDQRRINLFALSCALVQQRAPHAAVGGRAGGAGGRVRHSSREQAATEDRLRGQAGRGESARAHDTISEGELRIRWGLPRSAPLVRHARGLWLLRPCPLPHCSRAQAERSGRTCMRAQAHEASGAGSRTTTRSGDDPWARRSRLPAGIKRASHTTTLWRRHALPELIATAPSSLKRTL